MGFVGIPIAPGATKQVAAAHDPSAVGVCQHRETDTLITLSYQSPCACSASSMLDR